MNYYNKKIILYTSALLILISCQTVNNKEDVHKKNKKVEHKKVEHTKINESKRNKTAKISIEQFYQFIKLYIQSYKKNDIDSAIKLIHKYNINSNMHKIIGKEIIQNPKKATQYKEKITNLMKEIDESKFQSFNKQVNKKSHEIK